MVFVGVAQEKAQAFPGKKIDGQFVFTRDKTVYVNHYYFYIDDADFGPLFLKVCSYAPWSTKLCLNGHEWAKRQLARIPLPLRRQDRKAGYDWNLSIWQMEVSLTQIFAGEGCMRLSEFCYIH